MKCGDIPGSSGRHRSWLPLSDLLNRARSKQRVGWTDLPQTPGVYCVCWSISEDPLFTASAGEAEWAISVRPLFLADKWKRISKLATDIIYIGKADNLCKRVRTLARFGVGKSDKHKGGEWMWQITQISTASVLLQECPSGEQVAFENCLLERFRQQHGDWPLANRNGPRGLKRWPR